MRLIGYAIESIWNPKIQITYIDTKNQLSDVLTKGSFTRDEWDHLFRVLNIVNSRCFPAAIFFQTESRVSYPRELRVGQLKKVPQRRNRDRWNLVSRNLLSAKKTPPQDSSDPNSPVNHELDQSRLSFRDSKLTRKINQNPTMCSQERQQDHIQSSSTRKLGRREMNLQAQPAPGSKSEGQRLCGVFSSVDVQVGAGDVTSNWKASWCRFGGHGL